MNHDTPGMKTHDFQQAQTLHWPPISAEDTDVGESRTIEIDVTMMITKRQNNL
jgi:hypothetical protein